MRKLGKKELDTVGRRLFEAARLDQTVTDRIADSPELFRSVLKQIEAISRDDKFEHRPGFSFRFSFLHGTLAAAVVLVVAVAGSSLLFTGIGKDKEMAVGSLPLVPAAEPVVSRSVTPPESGNDNLLPTDREAERSARPERASFRTAAPARRPVRPQIPEIQETAEEFYPLTFAGDPYETARGGRVIRVDMPRSSLFAMGVDLPLENEPDSIKADLLVGPDGVARGIRIVR